MEYTAVYYPVYFPTGWGSNPPGWYRVHVGDYNKERGTVDILVGDTEVTKVNDEWGLGNWGFLPFDIAIGNKWLKRFFWLIIALVVFVGYKKLK